MTEVAYYRPVHRVCTPAKAKAQLRAARDWAPAFAGEQGNHRGRVHSSGSRGASTTGRRAATAAFATHASFAGFDVVTR